MKEYIYLTIFSVGLIWNIIARISFEKEKNKKPLLTKKAF